MSSLIATGSQTIGPFFKVGLWQPQWSDLLRDGTAGEPIRIEGTVLDGDGTPIPDALVEIWQADANGTYAHPDDPRATTVQPLFRGFGRCGTDAEGRFAFRTIVPGPVPGDNGGTQAPHINVTVFARGLLKRLVTRIYFSDRAEQNAKDPVLANVPQARRATLIAERREAGTTPVYTFDIHLQGENETVFFEI